MKSAIVAWTSPEEIVNANAARAAVMASKCVFGGGGGVVCVCVCVCKFGGRRGEEEWEVVSAHASKSSKSCTRTWGMRNH